MSSSPDVNTTPQKTNTQSLPVINGSHVFALLNIYRASKGLPFFTVSDELCNIAESRAAFIIQDNFSAFKTSKVGDHTGFREAIGNYSGVGVGENLAYNVLSDEATITLWKNSPPHNALMLMKDYNGTPLTKACIADKVILTGDIVVLEIGDK